MTDRFPLSANARRLLTVCDRIFGEVPAGEVVAMQFGLGVKVFADVPFDSRAPGREAA